MPNWPLVQRTALYRLFDLAFESPLKLEGLAIGHGPPAFKLELGDGALVVPSQGRHVSTWDAGPGFPWLVITRYGTHYYFRFPDRAGFAFQPGSARVICHPVPHIPWSTFEHLLLDQVLPLVLSLSGECVLHCSSVCVAEGGLAFLGKSGQGKSTLAFSLATATGAALMSDDCLLLRGRDAGIEGVPSYPSLRLWPEASSLFDTGALETSEVADYTSKWKVRVASSRITFSAQPVRMCSLYMLSTRPEEAGDLTVRIEPLSVQQAFVELVQTTFQLDPTSPVLMKGHTERLAAVASALPMFRLSYPHTPALLPEVVHAVREHAASLAQAAERA